LIIVQKVHKLLVLDMLVVRRTGEKG